jgi:cytidyltransferase-like protein
MRKVFVSGCYDILHGGHVEFFTQAKALGDYLVVSVAGEKALWLHKDRKPSLPIEHKKKILEALMMVDEVVIGEDEEDGLDFKSHFLRIRPQILAVTEDDKYGEKKKALCAQTGAEYIALPKTLSFQQISTSEILAFAKAPKEVPLRVDFAGGWLDVPKLSIKDGFVVNCSIEPLVSLESWVYEMGGGLGGSAAYAFLTGKDPVKSELSLGVGWQDPAVIKETGLCVWESGLAPRLFLKRNPELLRGKMALLWTGESHVTYEKVDLLRNYELISRAGQVAACAVLENDYGKLCEAVKLSYQAQLGEGMKKLPDIAAMVKKYCGGGWGGYALFMFGSERERDGFLIRNDTLKIEPFIA